MCGHWHGLGPLGKRRGGASCARGDNGSSLADGGGGGYFPVHAGVVKLVDTRDLKSLGFGHAGSSPAARTIRFRHSGTRFRGRRLLP